MRWLDRTGLQTITIIGALIPLALIAWDFIYNRLTANPIQEIQIRSGRYTLTLLLLSLACTPVYIISGFKTVLRLRRTLGLFAFGYATFHLLNLVGLDYGFNFVWLSRDLSSKPYIFAGLAAYLILLPLAITSTKGWAQRLGDKWKKLHRLVYLAAVLAVVHYIWQTKADFRLPLTYGGVLLILLAIRLPLVRTLATRHFKWLDRTMP